MSGTATGRAARLAAFFDRQDVLMRVVPLGALYVGAIQHQHSHGFTAPFGVVGFFAVALFYVGQTALLVRDPRWARSSRAFWLIAPAPFAALLFDLFLVDPMPPVFWAWLVAPVMMITVYLCRLRNIALTGVFVFAAGLGFFAASGIDPRSDLWLLGTLLAAWTLPAVLTRRVLGDLAERAEDLKVRSGRDQLSGALNRAGLEDQFPVFLERLARDDDARFSVLVVDLVRVKEIGELMGNTVVTGVLERTSDVLRRAYRRDHLLARPRGDSFVIVTPHEAGPMSAVVVDEIRRAHQSLGVSARVGAVCSVPARDVSPSWLGGLVRAAEEQAHTAADGAVQVVGFCSTAVRPGPRQVSAVDSDVLDDEQPAALTEASAGLFGTGLTVVALLVAAVQPSTAASPSVRAIVLALCAGLAVVGVLTAVGWVGGRMLHVAATLVGLGVAAVTVPAADGPYAAYVLLVLVPFPVYLAALTLPMSSAVWLTALLPGAALYALFRGPFPPGVALTAFFAVIGFGLVTCAMALWVRRQRDLLTRRLYRMTLVDSGTGLLSREGLVERYRSMPAGTELALVYLDVDDMVTLNTVYGYHGGDAILRRVGAVLAEVVRPEGSAARVGGDEFVLLVPGPGRSTDVIRRLTQRLAAEEVPVHVSLGQAFGRTDGDTTLWRLMAQADEALLLNRARERRSAVGRTAVDLRSRRVPRVERTDIDVAELVEGPHRASPGARLM